MVVYASIPVSTAQRLTANFHDALPPIDIDQAPLVSEGRALQAMQKRLSDIASLGSQVRVGRPVKQLVRDKLVWVALFEHSGFFKWFADGGTPGYLTVHAHDRQTCNW